MKHGNTKYAEFPREFMQVYVPLLSPGAVRLYCWLKELEQRYCSETSDTFHYDDYRLAEDLNCSRATIARNKAELKCYPELIEMRLVHLEMANYSKSSWRTTEYKLL